MLGRWAQDWKRRRQALPPAPTGARDGGGKCWRAAATGVQGNSRQVLKIGPSSFLLEAAPNSSAIVFFFCWNQSNVLLPRLCFAGTSVPICYHHVWFLLEPTQKFATMFLFVEPVYQFCYQHLRFLLEPIKKFATMFLLGRSSIQFFCYYRFEFCYYRRCQLLHPFS